MNAAEAICPGCNKVFTPNGLSQHIAKTRNVRCLTVHAASQPRSLFQPSPYERPFLTLTPGSTLWDLPDWSFGSEYPSGRDGIPSDLLAFPPLGNVSIATRNMDDSECPVHRSGPCTKLRTAMNVNGASNSADIQVDHQANNSADGDGTPDTTDPTDGDVFEADDPANNTTDGDGMPNTTDTTDADLFEADDPANNTTDGDGMPDTADTTDADIFEIITQTQMGGFPDLNLTAPNCEQIPSELAELGSLPENPPNLVEPSSADVLPQVVVERFPFGNPGAPINSMQDSSVYESRQEMFGGSVWAPFQSDSDWRVALWAKMNGISSSAVTELLAIPNVCHPLFFFIMLLNVV